MDADFESIYKEYYTPVYRYLLSLTKDTAEAEELTQETFFKALKNIEKYDPAQKMLTWLCAIGKNAFFSQQRKAGKETELHDSLADDDNGILDRIIDSETSMEILQILHTLPEPYKEVFTLRVLGNLSFQKIGGVFGKTESWARVTFFRSKTKIQEQLEK
ncbi:MAG: RNA polymerase sigma factor [Ruminococcaceae bacterium]|nr:RNA polymerase sigma factor [Oscillospiraceae bacterium]